MLVAQCFKQTNIPTSAPFSSKVGASPDEISVLHYVRFSKRALWPHPALMLCLYLVGRSSGRVRIGLGTHGRKAELAYGHMDGDGGYVQLVRLALIALWPRPPGDRATQNARPDPDHHPSLCIRNFRQHTFRLPKLFFRLFLSCSQVWSHSGSCSIRVTSSTGTYLGPRG